MSIQSIRRNQSGMVSIMVSMIMLLIISLIVLGFAQISRQEQRQSLDRQLSSQAFLAAESGVNDARTVVNGYLTQGLDVPEKTSCAPDSNYPASAANPVLSDTNKVSYSCLLVTTRLKNITSSLSANGRSVAEPFQPAATAEKMHIVWKDTTGSAPATGCASTIPASAYFPSASGAGWTCPYGILRADIVPTDTLTRAALASSQKTFFFYPTQNGSGSQPLGGSTGSLSAMRCAAATGCVVDVTGMGAAANYMVRLTAIYAGGTFDISALDASGTSLELRNAQVQVDATGKAQDVLRRIQVRLPMAPASNNPDYAIESGSSICKRFEISGTSFTIPGTISTQDPKNPTCVAVSVNPLPPCNPVRDVMIVVDASLSESANFSGSGAPPTKFDLIKSGLTYIAQNSNVTAGGVHEGLISFSWPATLETTFTGDKTALLSAVNGVTLSGGTSYLNPLSMVRSQYESSPAMRPAAERIVVFISDGKAEDFADVDAYGLDITGSSNYIKNTLGARMITVGVGTDAPTYPYLLQMASTPSDYYAATTPALLDLILKSINDSLKC